MDETVQNVNNKICFSVTNKFVFVTVVQSF